MRRSPSVIFFLIILVVSGLPGPRVEGAQETVYSDTMDSVESGLLSTETFDPTISFAYQDSQFVVDVQQPSYRGDIISTLAVPELASSRLTVDAFIGGEPANKYVIAGCRQNETGEGYFFGYLPATGDILLWRRDAAGDTNLAQSVEPSLIAPVNTMYQIGIDCWTNVMTGIVNGEPVMSIFDPAYEMGRPAIGVGANGLETDGLTVAFDNLEVVDHGNLALGPETPVGQVPASAPIANGVPQIPPSTGNGVIERVFEQGRTQALANGALVSDLAGVFTQEQDVYAFAPANVGIADFYTIVTFTNPIDLSAPIDVGIGFRAAQGSESGWRLVFWSDGSWFLQQPGQDASASGLAPGFDWSPGAANTIELLVMGSTGIVAVNGTITGQLDLSSIVIPGDLSVGAGFFAGDTLPGRQVSYANWWVYPTNPLDVKSG